MAARTGAQYIAGLRDDRSIWVNGSRVTDVTDYPGFAGSLQGLAGYFDWQHTHAIECLSDGENISHQIPRCLEDLSRRHVGLERLARYSAGMLGRTPDYVNVTFAGFAGQPSIWKQEGNEGGYENLVAFQREAAEGDLALTHTIIHPIVDKRTRDYEGENRSLALNKVDETAESIVVSGARILATLGPFADELTVYPGHPIPKDQPELALAFSVPMNAPGLKVICRDHYGESTVTNSTSRFPAVLTNRMHLSFLTTSKYRSTEFSAMAYLASTTRLWGADGPETSCNKRASGLRSNLNSRTNWPQGWR